MRDASVEDPDLIAAARSVPAGAWAVAVSGGADSVALLRLLRAARPDVLLHVVHLDHETRASESAVDAAFVSQLARSLGIPVTLARRSDVESSIVDLPANVSARFRACRMELFRRAVREQSLQGVLVAHHSDDQAESILLRLLRGSSHVGLAGMAICVDVDGLTVFRPLLNVRRAALRSFLIGLGQVWREDLSNTSDAYARSRVRKLLAGSEAVVAALIELSKHVQELKTWTQGQRPEIGAEFRARELAELPEIVTDSFARGWLAEQGVGEDNVDTTTVARLITLATDAASPAVVDFPSGVRVRRRGGLIGRATDVRSELSR